MSYVQNSMSKNLVDTKQNVNVAEDLSYALIYAPFVMFLANIIAILLTY